MARAVVAIGVAAASLAATAVHAHSWIDCFDTDRSKIYDQSASYIFGGAGGNGFCEGYGAGYPGRGDIDIGTEYTYKMLLNEVEAGAPVCQNVGDNTYSDWRKRISVAPGTQIYYAYLPNGHIVKDKKGVGTQHGIYWTGVPGTSLSTTKDMTADNLIDGVTLDYDDGNCGETLDFYGNPGGRAGDGKPCIGHFTVPSGTAAGIYKMVWYWTFYRPDGEYMDATLAKGYFGASYSTCFEVEVTGSGGSAPAATPAAPEVTTAAPEVTTAAPEVTTAAPEVTTAAPVATTAAPVASTAAPEATTATPEATTATPEATTAAPEAEPVPAATEAAEAATTTPEATTATPSATIATESRSLDFSSLSNSSSSDIGTVNAGSESASSSEVDDVVGIDYTDSTADATSSAPTTEESSASSSSDRLNVQVESNSAARMNGGASWLVTVSSSVAVALLVQLLL